MEIHFHKVFGICPNLKVSQKNLPLLKEQYKFLTSFPHSRTYGRNNIRQLNQSTPTHQRTAGWIYGQSQTRVMQNKHITINPIRKSVTWNGAFLNQRKEEIACPTNFTANIHVVYLQCQVTQCNAQGYQRRTWEGLPTQLCPTYISAKISYGTRRDVCMCGTRRRRRRWRGLGWNIDSNLDKVSSMIREREKGWG